MAKVPKGYYRGPDGQLYPWTPQMLQSAGRPSGPLPHQQDVAASPAGPPVERKPWYKQLPVWAWALIGGAFLVVAIGALASPEEPEEVSSTSETTAERTSTTAGATSTTERETTTTTAAPTTTVPPETVSQSNARSMAADYLRYTAFSRSGLIDQLKFEGFSEEDAAFGVDALNVDWNDQAAQMAAQYLDYSSFSRSGLINQLVFEGFSQAEAEYGVSTTGL